MAVTEREVAIHAFTDKGPGFTAILKHTYIVFALIGREGVFRWRDFHVNEIGLDGGVLSLTKLLPDAVAMEEERVEGGETFDGDVERLAKIVGREDAQKLHLLKEQTPSMEYIQFGPVSDKEQRKVIHNFFKSPIVGLPALVTETVKEGDLSYIRVTPFAMAKKNSKWDKRNRTQARNKNANGESCRYLHFVLYKENMDNQMAITSISRALGVPPSVFRIAGTKDKRGITTQLVSGQNIDPKKLAKVNEKIQRVKVGNFTPSKDNLFIGDLLGNQFRIVLRNVQPPNALQISETCEKLKLNGFLNYFGLQRFGQGCATHLVGIALLKGDWKGAARLILQPSPSDDSVAIHAKELYLKQNFEGALKLLPRKYLSERAILEGYVELSPEQHLQSINKINRNTRTLYVHAYQSYVWNHVVSERFKRFGANRILEGDIILENVEKGAHRKIKDKARCVQFVTKEDIANERYNVEDIVLPIPGSSVEFPRNDIAQIYHEIAQRDGISLTKSKHRVKEFSIEKVNGDYRKMIVKVPDLEYEIVNYKEAYEPLIASDLELLQEAGVEGSFFPGPVIGDEFGKRKADEDEEEESRKKAKVEVETNTNEEKMALKLKFKLPASSYATMLVRQLTKYSTSKMAQMAITTDQDRNMSSLD